MLSFRYPGGQEVSILVSKNSGRYRLQSGCLEAMWLVLQVSTCGKFGGCKLRAVIQANPCSPTRGVAERQQRANTV